LAEETEEEEQSKRKTTVGRRKSDCRGSDRRGKEEATEEEPATEERVGNRRTAKWGTKGGDLQKQNWLLLGCGCDGVVSCSRTGALLAMNGSTLARGAGSQNGCGPSSGKPK
jgi:hypothetical protein